MKRILIYVIMIFFSIAEASGQSIEFLYAGQDSTSNNCTSLTNCSNNQLCFYIEYTPSITGTLTSYTMGFKGNCSGIGLPVFDSNSCVINDNSANIDACGILDSFLMQVSGNGSYAVVANEPVILHQVCFQIDNGYVLNLLEDEITDITANIDSLGNNVSYTEFINFDELNLDNGACQCFQLTQDSGSPDQALNCLSPIVPIQYQLNNCDTALVSNLAPGLSSVLENGILTIDGTPTHEGDFTFVIHSDGYCECDPKINMLAVPNSIVMIDNKCYTKVEDAIIEYNNGETIEILGDLITKPSTLSSLNNINVILRSGWRWSIKE